MIRALAHQNEQLRQRLSMLERQLGVASRDDRGASHLPYDGDELPPADGG
jgi:hypothetical protein